MGRHYYLLAALGFAVESDTQEWTSRVIAMELSPTHPLSTPVSTPKHSHERYAAGTVARDALQDA